MGSYTNDTVELPCRVLHNREPLIEPPLRIPLLLQLPQPGQTFSIDLFEWFITMREVYVPVISLAENSYCRRCMV